MWDVGKGLAYGRSDVKEYAKAELETKLVLFFYTITQGTITEFSYLITFSFHLLHFECH